MLEGFVARGGPWGEERLLCVAAGSVSTGDEGSSLATIKLFIDFFILLNTIFFDILVGPLIFYTGRLCISM